MLREQIEALEDNMQDLELELAMAEDIVREVKKKIQLTRAALKSLVGLEEKLADN